MSNSEIKHEKRACMSFSGEETSESLSLYNREAHYVYISTLEALITSPLPGAPPDVLTRGCQSVSVSLSIS